MLKYYAIDQFLVELEKLEKSERTITIQLE